MLTAIELDSKFYKSDRACIYLSTRVLLNLVGNAIKFTHYGEVVVHCSLDKEHEDGSISLKISVKDTGIGMSKEEMKGLFLPFSQVDGSTTR
jgi:signal transduction histidine kinase